MSPNAVVIEAGRQLESSPDPRPLTYIFVGLKPCDADAREGIAHAADDLSLPVR